MSRIKHAVLGGLFAMLMGAPAMAAPTGLQGVKHAVSPPSLMLTRGMRAGMGSFGAPAFSAHPSFSGHPSFYGHPARFYGHSPRVYGGGPYYHHHHHGHPYFAYYGGYYPYYWDNYYYDDYDYPACYYSRRLHARVCPDY